MFPMQTNRMRTTPRLRRIDPGRGLLASSMRALSSTYRRRESLVGIHNYGDVNRRRTTYTRLMIRQAREHNRSTRFWFTETGGIVKFGRSFPWSTERAKNRLSGMFSLAKRYRTSGVQRLYVYNFTGAGCSARRSKLRGYLR